MDDRIAQEILLELKTLNVEFSNVRMLLENNNMSLKTLIQLRNNETESVCIEEKPTRRRKVKDANTSSGG